MERKAQGRQINLTEQVKFKQLWPTPQSREFRTGESHRWDNHERSRNLNDAIAKYPTPRASEYKGCGPLGSSSHHHHRLEKKYLDATVQEQEQRTGQLNPDWVECLMGWPPFWTSLQPLPVEVFEMWLENYDKWWMPEVWDYLESLIPRLATGVPDRVPRLKGIGNGQVPLCVAAAWGALT